MMKAFWDKEPVILSLFGSAAVWIAVFAVCSAFGHPLNPNQQTALLALLAAAGGVIGRGQVTPTGATDQTVDLNKIGKPAIVLACVLGGAAAFSMPACGPKAYHNAVVANTTLAQSIFTLQDAEIAAHNAKLIPDAKHAEYKAQILKLLEAGDDLTEALRQWDPAQPAPANVSLALSQVSKLLGDLKINSPQAEQVIVAVQIVLNVLRGSGVLPAARQMRQELLGLHRVLVAAVAHGADRRELDPRERRDLVTHHVADAHRGRLVAAITFWSGFHASILFPEVARG